MPRKNAQTDAPADTPTDVAATVDVGQSEVQAVADEATAKGYFGTARDPFPNSAYSLESGPESPSAADAHRAIRDSKES